MDSAKIRYPVSDQVFSLVIVFSMLLWGLSWPSSKVLTRYVSPTNLVAYRYFFAVLTLLPPVVLSRSGIILKRAGLVSVVASGGLLALYAWLFFLGLKLGNAGAGGVLVTTLNPLFTYTFGMIFGRRRPSGAERAGLALGVAAGCILLKVWDHPSAILHSGNSYFLLAAITWAAMSMITSRARQYGPSLTFSLWQYTVTTLCLVPFLSTAEIRNSLHIADPVFWLNLLFSAAIVTSVATTVYFYATTRVGAERASTFIFIVPLAAAVSAWLLLGEPILPHTAIGGILGIAAVYLINRKKKTNL